MSLTGHTVTTVSLTGHTVTTMLSMVTLSPLCLSLVTLSPLCSHWSHCHHCVSHWSHCQHSALLLCGHNESRCGAYTIHLRLVINREGYLISPWQKSSFQPSLNFSDTFLQYCLHILSPLRDSVLENTPILCVDFVA